MARDRKAPDLESAAVLRHWLDAVPNDRLAHLIRDAARGLVRSLQLRLSAHGVSFGHWAFLRALWEVDGVTQRELSLRVGMMESTTFAALTALETLGYIIRRHKPPNRKNVFVYLTPAGAALKGVLVPLAEAVNEVAVRGIAPDEIAGARRMLLAMIHNLADDAAAAAADERRIPSTREMARRIEAARHKTAAGARKR